MRWCSKIFPQAVQPREGAVAPVSAAPPGKMAARLAAKHKNKRPGLPTEPFVYVAMTAAFPGVGAAHLFRATGSVAPVSVAPPGKMAARLAAKYKNKRPSLSTEPFVLFDAWQFPTLTWGDPTLPSALRRFTSEFGMGSGGTTALSPPGKFCFTSPSYDALVNLYHAENHLKSAKTPSAL